MEASVEDRTVELTCLLCGSPISALLAQVAAAKKVACRTCAATFKADPEAIRLRLELADRLLAKFAAEARPR